MAAATMSAKPADVQPAAPPSPTPSLLTPAHIAIVKATAPVLKEHGVTITTLMYQNLLADIPELKNVFNMNSQANGLQPRALAGSVLAYATYIDDLPKLAHAVERIAQKHASLHIQPAQYAIVGRYLLAAIGAVLGDAATPEIVEAWTIAYGVLADVFIGREKLLYKVQEEKNWVGWRKFKILKRVAESASIDSFYLAPADGARLPSYLPGQYISVQAFVPSLGHLQSRQYSLSAAPRKEGDYYRISVKKDARVAPEIPGLISNLLHDEFKAGDEVELSHPQGEFFVDLTDKSKEGVPLVLISAGVGATPIMSILESVTRDPSDAAVQRPISWLHASRSRAEQPFAGAVRQIQRANPDRMSAHVFLRDVTQDDQAGSGADFDFGGARMDLGRVDREKHLFVSSPQAEYYMCGPEGFMVDTKRKLQDLGVDAGRIHLELFATGDVE